MTGQWSSASSIRARFHAPGVVVVALVPSAGPVPPPMIVVMPAPSASSSCCGQIRWTWQSIAPAVRILPLPDMISVDGPITSAGSTPSIVSGLPALPMPTMRPSRTPMSALTMPQWSRITAPVITRSGAPSARVARRLAHRLADHLAAAEHRLVAADAVVLGDLDPQVGVGEADAVAGGRPVQRAVAIAAIQLMTPSAIVRRWSGRSSSGPATSPRSPATMRLPDERHEVDVGAMPGSKRTDVPAGTSRRWPWAAARSKRAPGWPRRSGSASRPGSGRSPVFSTAQRRAPAGRR